MGFGGFLFFFCVMVLKLFYVDVEIVCFDGIVLEFVFKMDVLLFLW